MKTLQEKTLNVFKIVIGIFVRPALKFYEIQYYSDLIFFNSASLQNGTFPTAAQSLHRAHCDLYTIEYLEKCKVLSREQYGGRQKEAAILHARNKRLTFDL